MIDLTSKVVRFHLSAEGRRALKGLVPARGPFEALVLSVGDLGPLVWTSVGVLEKQAEQVVPAMLLRWDYIATMIFDHQTEPTAPPPRIGFRPV